jgi:hypothetical protein
MTSRLAQPVARGQPATQCCLARGDIRNKKTSFNPFHGRAEIEYLSNFENLWPVRMFSGFRQEVEDICALLGYYAAYSGKSLLSFRGNLSVPWNPHLMTCFFIGTYIIFLIHSVKMCYKWRNPSPRRSLHFFTIFGCCQWIFTAHDV